MSTMALMVLDRQAKDKIALVDQLMLTPIIQVACQEGGRRAFDLLVGGELKTRGLPRTLMRH